MKVNTNVKERLEDLKIPFKENVDLKNITYSCTGGMLKLYIAPYNSQQFIDIVRYFITVDKSFVLSGGTSNLLFLDFVNYNYLISTNGLNNVKYNLENNTVSVESGVELSKFVRLNLMNRAVGFEGLEGIPGTVGGAIFQNAGAYGYFISDHLIQVKVLDLKGNILTLSKQECDFGMRRSIFQKEGFIILQAEFTLPKGDLKRAEKKIEIYHIARHSYQEWVYPNLGSVFVTDSNVYDSMAKSNYKFKWALLIVKLLMNNPLYKRCVRRRPSNKLKNKLVEYFFNVANISDTYSHKSINTFLNKGDGTLNILKYYCELDRILGEDANLENEIVFQSLDCITNEKTMHDFEKIISEHPRLQKKVKWDNNSVK